MANKKVRVGTTYIYYPVLLDRIHPPAGVVQPGDIVVVVNLHGAPPANTMGHCYVNVAGKFGGLVCTNSLYPLAEKQLVIDALKADAARLSA